MLSRRLMVIVAGFALATSAGVLLAVAWAVERAVTPMELRRHGDDAARLEELVSGARGDVIVGVHGAPVREALESQRAAAAPSIDAVTRLFHAQLLARPEYLQARLIGADGVEVVRVAREEPGGAIRVMQGEQLRDESDRSDVASTLARPRGDLFVSPAELNGSGGASEGPAVPVLRVGAPVYGDAEALGLVILDVDMRAALGASRLRRHESVATLLDEQGDDLVHPRRARELGFEQGTAVAHGGVWQVALLVAVLAAVASSLVAYFIGRSVTRPLQRMTIMTQELAQGRSDASLPVDAPGEIGRLSRALARMRDLIMEHATVLERQNERFRLMIETAPTAAVAVDSRGTITLVNAAAERLFGYARQELLGKAVEVLVPTAVRAHHPELRRGFAANPSVREMGAGRDLHARHKDGRAVPVEIGLSPIDGPEGMTVLASIVDLTERKRHENELRRSNTELEQFAHVASHDLQEPLRMVASYTELLAQRYQGRLDERADKYIRYAVEGARRMQQLVADLLQYSRVESRGRPLAPVDLSRVAERVVTALRPLIQDSGAVIQLEELPKVMADAGQVFQVMQNVIANAIKFRGEHPPKVVVRAERREHQWLVSVADNGIGIEPQYRERVFEMFQRLHEREEYDGSGIGLAIAKRIVERHGGRIWAEANPGGGTVIAFTMTGAEDVPT